MGKLQFRTITETEYDTETGTTKILKSFTTPLSGWKQKPKKKKVESISEELGSVEL